jgi:hypothetical protein
MGVAVMRIAFAAKPGLLILRLAFSHFLIKKNQTSQPELGPEENNTFQF